MDCDSKHFATPVTRFVPRHAPASTSMGNARHGRENAMNQVRIGLLVDDMAMPAWVANMICHIQQEQNLSIALIMRNRSAKKGYRYFPVRSKAMMGTAFFYHLWMLADARRYAAKGRAMRTIDVSASLAGVPILDLLPIQQDDIHDEFSEEDTARIAHHRLDVLLQLGFRRLRGGILQAAACGVWTYRYGDDAADRCTLPGVWEVLRGTDVTGCTLEILAPDPGHNLVLYRTWSPIDLISPARGLDHSAWKMGAFVPRRLRELRQLGNAAFLQKYRRTGLHAVAGSDLPCAFPDNLTVARLLGGRIFQKIAARLKNRNVFEQWALLYRFDGADYPGPIREFKPLLPPKDRFWADPCVVEHGGRHAIFLEECEYANNIGYISAILFDDREKPVLPPVKIMTKPHHLSYPFIFEDQGTLYMIPEAASASVIPLYRCRQFPHDWEFVMNLMEDIIAYDTTIWHHNGKYWLFATVCDDREASSWDELSLYSSDTLLSTDWQPHPCNPIVSDVRCARSAGRIFERDGKWYRPAQDCSRRYGGAIALRQIVTIDEQSYKEVTADRIEATPDDGIIGTHTLSHAGRLTCLDGIVRRRKTSMGTTKYAAFAHPFLSTVKRLSLRNRG